MGAVLSHTVLLVPMKATSNQKAIPCTVPVCEIFGSLLIITSTVEGVQQLSPAACGTPAGFRCGGGRFRELPGSQ